METTYRTTKMIVFPLRKYKKFLGNGLNIVSGIVEELNNLGNCYIAGGFVRDLHFGNTPKDIDIIVGKHVDVPQLAKHLFKKGLIKSPDVKKLGLDDDEIKENYEGDGRIKAVYQVEAVIPIDIIQLNRNIAHPHEAVESFDFNINQSFLSYDKEVGDVFAYINDDTELKLYVSVKDKRLVRMIDKAREANVKISTFLWARYKGAKNRLEIKGVVVHAEVIHAEAGVQDMEFF